MKIENLERIKLRFNVLVGSFSLIGIVPAIIATSGFQDYQQFISEGNATEARSSAIVSLIMCLVVVAVVLYAVWSILRFRKLVGTKKLNGFTLCDEVGRCVDLRTSEVRPLIRKRGAAIWPLSEIVVFSDRTIAVWLAPAILDDSSREAFHRAWCGAGREFTEYSASAMQDALPKGY